MVNNTGDHNEVMYKTSMCRTFSSTGSCPYGYKCLFAHGPEELRTVTDNELLQVQGASPRQVPNYRTSIYSKTNSNMLTPVTPQQSTSRAYSVMSAAQQQQLPSRQQRHSSVVNQSLVAQSARRSRAFFPVDGISPRHLMARTSISGLTTSQQQQLPVRSNTAYLAPSSHGSSYLNGGTASASASPISAMSHRSMTPSQALLNISTPSPRKWASASGAGDETADAQASPVDQRKQSVTSTQAKTPQAMERAKKLYKTEVCRSWMEYNMCPYGAKCQFAHGEAELRQVERHRKYKTEKCKKFHSEGVCPFGSRCIFIHEEDERELPNSPKYDPVFAAQMRQRRASGTPVRHLSPSLNAMSPLGKSSPMQQTRSMMNSPMNALSLGGAASPMSQKQTRNSISYTKRFSRFGDEHAGSAVDDFIKRRMTDASIDSVARLGNLGNGIAGLSLKDMGKSTIDSAVTDSRNSQAAEKGSSETAPTEAAATATTA